MIDFRRELKDESIYDKWIEDKLEYTDEECPNCLTQNVVYDSLCKSYWCKECCSWINLDLTNDN